MNRFAELRAKAGMNQETAAQTIGVERSTVAKWETGASYPRASLLPSIAEAYQCKIDDFYSSEPEQKTEQAGA